ncbi:MAG: peptidylprolyl isomerase [Clostridia bacterium]|nr:peptidylprolyl isomerase [Clostridia bacterium]
MKKKQALVWSLIAALCLMTVITVLVLLRSYNSNQSNQSSLADLQMDLNRVKEMAAEKDTELKTQAAAYQQQLEETRQQLASVTDDRDSLLQRVQAMDESASQAAKDAEALQSKYDAAAASLDAQTNRIAEMSAEIESLKAAHADTNNRSAQEQSSLQEALNKAQAELAATAEQQMAQSEQAAALREELDAVMARAAQDAELLQSRYDTAVAALSVQTNRIADLNAQIESLKAAQRDADLLHDNEQNSLREMLDKAQAELDALQEEKKQLNESLSALKEQAEAELAATAEQQMAQSEQAAALREELDAAMAQAAQDADLLQSRYDTAVAALSVQTNRIADLNGQIASLKAAQTDAEQLRANEQSSLQETLGKAQAELDSLQKNKEEQEKTIADLTAELNAAKAASEKDKAESAAKTASLNEQISKVQTELENERKEKEAQIKTASQLTEELNAAKAAAEKETKDSTAKIADLNGKIASAQAELDAAAKENGALNASIAALNEQLAAGEKAAAQANAQISALSEELTQTKTVSDENIKALSAKLDAAQKELAQAGTALADTQSALEKTAAEAAASAAALEETNQRLSAEAAELRDSLAAEIQKSAQLTEELAVQSAEPEALLKRLETVLSTDGAQRDEQLNSLSSLILRAFRESIEADPEGGVTHPAPVSVLMDGREVMSISYDLTETQEAQAYENAELINGSQPFFQIDLNHEKTAALIVNGVSFDRQSFENAYAEAFSQHPDADAAALNQLATEEIVKAEVLRQHAEALGLDADAPDMEARLWEAALKNVTVTDAEFLPVLKEQQQKEDEILAAHPAEYAALLQEGRIASSILPEKARFVKQLILPVDFAAIDELVAEMDRLQERLSVVNEIVYGQPTQSIPADELKKLGQERDLLAKQVSQLNSDRKLLLKNDERAKEKAGSLALQIREHQLTFEAAAALAQPDEAMPASGYAVFEGAALPTRDFAAAALTLKKQGDVSDPIKMADGYHVLYYSEEITENSASIQAAQDRLRGGVLAELLKATKESLLSQWISEAEVVSYIE